MKTNPFICILTCILLYSFHHNAKAEFYTAIAELEKLLGSVDTIIETLHKYIQKEEERMTKVKWLSDQFEKIQSAVDDDSETFLGNPINAYLLVKRLTVDWDILNQIVGNTESHALFQDITPEKLDIPSDDDLRGAAAALIRLQATFLLDAASLAKGVVKDTKSSYELSAGDCFVLGRTAIEEIYFKYSIQWLSESLKRLYDEKEPKTAIETDILEYMAFAHHELKNDSMAIELTEKILDLDPTNPRAGNNLYMYYKSREKLEAEKVSEKSHDESEFTLPEGYMPLALMDSFEKLCRGESVKTPEEESRLHCYQTNRDNKYLLLQPVKVEVLNLNPKIALYYDVLKESEADTIKAIALPMLNRATVVNGSSGKDEFASYRISKSAWIYDWSHPLMTKLNRRIADISNLDVQNAEPLHAINYGIGGHYNPHIDFSLPGEKISYFDELGNRIATWIFYLSHVPAGGSTVFPELGVEVKPVKGAAAFWYNLHKNGTGNQDTIHAACPVLTGSKWVANKWLHEKGNEFKRPCGLNQLE